MHSLIRQIGLVIAVLICGGGATWGVDYNDGTTHTISGSSERVNISNKTTVQVQSGEETYPFRTTTVSLNGDSCLTTNFPGGSGSEILGEATFLIDNSRIELTHYTANNNGITLSNNAVLRIGNAANNSYGALLGNGTGGINATSGTSFVQLYKSIGNEEELSYATLRDSNAKITVSQSATLEWLGGIRAHAFYVADAKVVVDGAGTLILKGGEIGGRNNSTSTSAGELAISGGGTVIFNGATIYENSKITVSGTGTTLNAANGSLNGSGEITVNQGAVLTMADMDGLLNAGKILLNAGTLNSVHYTTISKGLELNGGKVTSSGNYSKNPYGSFLFLNPLTVTGGTAEAPSVSEMSVVGARFRGQAASTMDVAEYTTLLYAGNVSYDNGSIQPQTNLVKAGKGTWNITSGTVGTYYAAAWGTESGTGAIPGVIHVKEGTLRMSGNSTFHGNSQIYVFAGGTLDLSTSQTFSVAYHLAGDGVDGMGALLFSNNRNITNSVYLDKAASIGVVDGVSATISSRLNSGYGLTKVGKGTLTLHATGNVLPSLSVLDGTLKLTQGTTLNSNTRSILVSGNDAVLEFAANDAIGISTGAAGVDGIVIQKGGTLVNTVNTTHVTLTHGFQLENGTVKALGEGNVTSGNASHGLGLGYGNYLLVDNVQVSGTGVSTIDAYRIRFRSEGEGGSFTIAPTAVLETNTRFDSDRGRSMTIYGGGTLRPTATSFTTPGLDIQGSTLDLTALDEPVTGAEWQLFNTTEGNAALALVDVAQVMNGSNVVSSGRFSMDSQSRLSIDLEMTSNGILGQTILADSFDIDNARLELNLLGDWTLDAVGAYPLFSEELLDVIQFTNLSILGNAGELVFSLDGNMLTIGVPEPSSWILMALVFLGYWGFRKQGRKR